MSQLADLAEDVGVAERTLRRAAGQGTLRAECLSPRKLRLVPGEAAYVRRNWQLLAALRQGLRTEPNVVFAMVFGSVARGDDRADSDVDLIVVLREQSLEKMVELQDRLRWRPGRTSPSCQGGRIEERGLDGVGGGGGAGAGRSGRTLAGASGRTRGTQ